MALPLSKKSPASPSPEARLRRSQQEVLSRLQVLRGLTSGKVVIPEPDRPPEPPPDLPPGPGFVPEPEPVAGKPAEVTTAPGSTATALARPVAGGRAKPEAGAGSIEPARPTPPVVPARPALQAVPAKLAPPAASTPAKPVEPAKPALSRTAPAPAVVPSSAKSPAASIGKPATSVTGPSPVPESVLDFIPGTGIPLPRMPKVTPVTAGVPWPGWGNFLLELPGRVRQVDPQQVLDLAHGVIARAKAGDRQARGILAGILLVISGTVIAATGGGEPPAAPAAPAAKVKPPNPWMKKGGARSLLQASANPDQPANYGNFLRRNPFELTTDDAPSPAPATIDPQPTAPPPDPGPDVDQVLNTVTLVGTYVSPGKQYAILQVKDQAKAELLEIGDRLELPGPPVESIEVAAITPREVQVAVRGATRSLRMKVEEWKAGGAPAPAAAAPAQAAAPAGPSFEAGGNTATAVRKMPRAELDHYLENLHTVLTQVNLQPAYQNGRQVGFRVGNIERGSLLERLGVENGDVVRFINGQRIDSVQSAYQVYNILRDSTNVEMTVLRNTRPVVLRYLVY